MLETFACSRVLTLSSLRSAASGDATLRAKTSPQYTSQSHLVPLTRPRTPPAPVQAVSQTLYLRLCSFYSPGRKRRRTRKSDIAGCRSNAACPPVLIGTLLAEGKNLVSALRRLVTEPQRTHLCVAQSQDRERLPHTAERPRPLVTRCRALCCQRAREDGEPQPQRQPAPRDGEEIHGAVRQPRRWDARRGRCVGRTLPKACQPGSRARTRGA